MASLSIISFALSVVALCVSWMPEIGIIGLPLGLAGIVLGAIGSGVYRTRESIAWGLTGVSISIVSLLLVINGNNAFSKGISIARGAAVRAAANREAEKQKQN